MNTMTDTDNADDLLNLTNTLTEADFLREQVEVSIGLYVNVNKTEFIFFKQEALSTLNDKPLKHRQIHLPLQHYFIC